MSDDRRNARRRRDGRASRCVEVRTGAPGHEDPGGVSRSGPTFGGVSEARPRFGRWSDIAAHATGLRERRFNSSCTGRVREILSGFPFTWRAPLFGTHSVGVWVRYSCLWLGQGSDSPRKSDGPHALAVVCVSQKPMKTYLTTKIRGGIRRGNYCCCIIRN